MITLEKKLPQDILLYQIDNALKILDIKTEYVVKKNYNDLLLTR